MLIHDMCVWCPSVVQPWQSSGENDESVKMHIASRMDSQKNPPEVAAYDKLDLLDES